jgi:hypothetical protein
MSIPTPAPAPPQKKMSPLVIILLVLLGLFALGAIAVVGGGLFIAHKLHQAAGNTGLAAAKVLAATNPDVDVVSTDDDRGTITIRDRKTGKNLTLSFDDIKNGRLHMEADGKQVSIEAKGDGANSGIEVKTSDGESMKFGGVGEKLPAWIPTFPGTPSSHGQTVSHNAKEDSGATSFELKQPVTKLSDYYYDALNKAGLKASKTMASDQMAVIQGTDDADRRAVVFTITGNGDTSTVNVSYHSKNKE